MVSKVGAATLADTTVTFSLEPLSKPTAMTKG